MGNSGKGFWRQSGLNSNMTNPISLELAKFTHDLSLEKIPLETQIRAKYLMLDAIGCGIAAKNEAFAIRLTQSILRLAGPGNRIIIGQAIRLPLRDSALLNGALMHGLDYDDTHAAGVAHLSVSTLPTALAIACDNHASGSQFLLSYIAGVETGARLASVVKGGFHQVGFHPTGLIGAFACALVAGKLLNLDVNQLVGAQGFALSFASGSLQFIEDGSWTKRVHPGWAAASGIAAAHFAQDDIPSPTLTYEGRFGLFASHLPPHLFQACDFNLATHGLADIWEVQNVAIKPMPACHFVHACTDAAIALFNKGIDYQRIKSIRALIPEGVVKSVAEPQNTKRRPVSDYDAKFSVHYCVASGLIRGKLGLKELHQSALTEPEVIALMDKITYEIDPQSTFPKHYTGEVIVKLDDDSEISHRVSINRGNPDAPISNEDIKSKFQENCSLYLTKEKTQEIYKNIMNIEKQNNCLELEKLLACA
jgi:2-methylcitrate dehydratase PrpD